MSFLPLYLLVGLLSTVWSYTPLAPTNGYTYVVEAARAGTWPSCAYRFLSHASTCDKVDLWNAAGANQYWQFISTGDSDGSFYLKSNCGGYLSYTSNCDDKATIDLWSQAGPNQKFRFIVSDNPQFHYYIEAVGRTKCAYHWLNFASSCSTSAPDKISFQSATGPNQRFRLYPISSTNPPVHTAATSFPCADPYAWKPRRSNEYLLQCTGNKLGMGKSSTLEPTSRFSSIGDALGGNIASWASVNARWAPENYESPDSHYNYILFADTQPNGIHRLGWAASDTGVGANQYDSYSSSYLNLGMAAGGDIDGHVFEDSDGKTYLVWKTDDNSVGSSYTRIWIQQLHFTNGTVSQSGSPQVILDSKGLWWVDSWVSGGSLIEGPEIIKNGNYYYLFFAAGKYCQDTYTEGVARSKSVFGPWEKMNSPVLSNGIVGKGKNSQGSVVQLVGPGHASVVNTGSGWRLVWHASFGEVCDRYAFISNLVFGADGWPYVNL